MPYQFAKFKKELEEIKVRLVKEFSVIRTGRATPAILDRLLVESYGSKVPIANVATIVLESPRTLRISPWDPKATKAIETALFASNLGVSLTNDGTNIFAIFPQLTEERKKDMVKTVKKCLEDARVIVRHLRDTAWRDIQNKERAHEIDEDEKYRCKEEFERIVSDAQKALEKTAENKEKEVMS